MGKKTAIIIGAGPAGLTAAYELLDQTDIKPVIYEMTDKIGGISRTEIYKGNRIDIGGHRFFSKHDNIIQWWFNILPLQGFPSKDDIALNRSIALSTQPDAPDPEKTDRVMLIRKRLSRILFQNKFYDYPIKLSLNMLSNLGIKQVADILASYIRIKLFPIKDEKSLEDYFINCFGRKLYAIFFKDFTEKLWGVPCSKISPEWGRQRTQGLSLSRAVLHAAKKIVSGDAPFNQRKIETTLIEKFVYPKFGPGQMWEEVARLIQEKGGEIFLNSKASAIQLSGSHVSGIEFEDLVTGKKAVVFGDYLISSMPVQELVAGFGKTAPTDVREVSEGLYYRDGIIVGFLLKKLRLKNRTNIKTINNIIPDNWIYIQASHTKVGRIQIVNNWNPYMVKDENTVWVCAELSSQEGDELWTKPDDKVAADTIEELVSLDIIYEEDVMDHVVIREKNVYPAYFGTYNRFDIIRNYLDTFDNLFLIGRNGMHRYNNMDHSMLTAMEAVKNIAGNITSKENIWNVNTENEYHEIKKS